MTINKVSFDVMILGGTKFYCTLSYPYNPLFPIDAKQLRNYVLEKRPTLRYQPFTIVFNAV